MQLNAPALLQPVFDFLAGIIRDYGDILFMLFTYAAIPFLVWVFCGGVRRKSLARKGDPNVPPVTVIYLPLGSSRPPPEPLPPMSGRSYEPAHCDYESDFYRD